MRIIKPGVRPDPIIQVFTCNRCGCIFEASSEDGLRMIETVDHIFHTTERKYVPVSCPTCGLGHRIYLERW